MRYRSKALDEAAVVEVEEKLYLVALLVNEKEEEMEVWRWRQDV